MTLGVEPRWAETGYGYLELGEVLDEGRGVRRVARFEEKPDAPHRRAVPGGWTPPVECGHLRVPCGYPAARAAPTGPWHRRGTRCHRQGCRTHRRAVRRAAQEVHRLRGDGASRNPGHPAPRLRLERPGLLGSPGRDPARVRRGESHPWRCALLRLPEQPALRRRGHRGGARCGRSGGGAHRRFGAGDSSGPHPGK